MKHSKRDQAEALESLHKWVKPGDTVYTVLDHVSRSGMSRHIRVLVPYTRDDGTIDHIHPNHAVGVVAGYSQAKRGDGLVVGGCGMDMGFSLVYTLSRIMFPKGFGCIGEKCPSNDHSNGDKRGRVVHGTVGGCSGLRCTCHDPSAWLVEGSYPEGCSACGCGRLWHWHKDGGYALKQRWL